ncbi:MAG: HNH endonuclease [Actinomycetota bacterium]
MAGCELHDDLVAAGSLVGGVTRALSGSAAAADGVEAPALAVLLRQARSVEANVASLVATIGARADALASEGRSAPADEFLLDEGRVRARTARDEAARAEVLAWAPDLAAGVGAGRVGADQLDSLARHTRNLNENARGRLRVDDLVREAGRLPADSFDAVVRRAVREADPGEADASAEQKRAASEFRHWADPRTQMGRFAGALDLERYEIFTAAVDRETVRLAAAASEPTSRDANLAAAALVGLVTGGGGRGGAGDASGADQSRTGGRMRAAISVVVDVATLAAARAGDDVPPEAEPGRTGNGHELTQAAVARLCCDAELRRVVLDEAGLPLDVGRNRRTATDAQWAALRAVHTTCAWPGCGQPIDRCQVHHIRPWSSGGPTDLANLVPLCSRHHHRVHEGRWRLRLDSNRAVHVRPPPVGKLPRQHRTNRRPRAPAADP